MMIDRQDGAAVDVLPAGRERTVDRRRFRSGRPHLRSRWRRWAMLSMVAASWVVFPCRDVVRAAPLPTATPEEVGLDSQHLQHIDRLIDEGLQAKLMPGCVVLLARHGKTCWLKAYGARQWEPQPLPMTVDTVFDMASITKPMATAASILILVDQGRVRLRDPVKEYIPEFGQNGKDEVTVFDLLTHQSGLLADNPVADFEQGPDEAWRRIWALGLESPRRTRFIYSDVGYIVLGELIRRVAGKDVHQFSQESIFVPLGMQETGYLPAELLRARAAPTEQRDGRWIQGEVHDPRAYHLGGISGHAGLFSTASDAAVYAQAMLEGGARNGSRILSSLAVEQMTRAYLLPEDQRRGLGWDKQSRYSINRGEYFSESAYGHGGFTGTVMWIDPHESLIVIFLSNRVHPSGQGSVNRLAGQIGTVVSASIRSSDHGSDRTALPQNTQRPVLANVRTGIDVLQETEFACIQERRVGLISNHTGRDAQGNLTSSILQQAPGVQLVAIFSPEHGPSGNLDRESIADGRDPATGLPVFSLYGQTRQPTAQQLQGIDTLVFDIQDIGTRFYTYISTMELAMRSAAEQRLRFVVLDRPNPIGGDEVYGPILDEGRESFVGCHRLPVQHGMTVGELAQLFRQELQLNLDLRVVPLRNWRRTQLWDETGLTWINPSPNMRRLTAALLYPGIGLLETTNVSVGRGTDTPFEVIGAPWIEARRLAGALNRAELSGVTFVPIEFTPQASVFANQPCQGVEIHITNRQELNAISTGVQIAITLRQLYKDEWDIAGYDRLLAHARTLKQLKEGATLAEIEAGWNPELQAFLIRRKPHLLY